MTRLVFIFLVLVVGQYWPRVQAFEGAFRPLVEAACIDCHDSDTETELDFSRIGYDTSDPNGFRMWERVFDRVMAGEMPPAKRKRPAPGLLEPALVDLESALLKASVKKQAEVGRVPVRRLTKLELGYTLQDLLDIDTDVTSGVPDEVNSGDFDTVGATQRISAVHMESYLEAADLALNHAYNLGVNPFSSGENDYSWLEEWHDKPLNLGGNVTRKLDPGPGIALFRDIDYLTQFQFSVKVAGLHRISFRCAAYQSKTPVTAKLIVKDPSGGARLVKAVDLQPDETRLLKVETFLKPGDVPYLTFDIEGKEPLVELMSGGGSKHYKGRGLAIMSQKVEGPLHDEWPPRSTRLLSAGMELKSNADSERGPFTVEGWDGSLEQVTEILALFGQRAFRRPVERSEIESFATLAQSSLNQKDGGWPLAVPLRSMLSSPQFLLLKAGPGKLDGFTLASRLSYFLWKSLPDDELFGLAELGLLSDPKILAEQVDRLLTDEKSQRFVSDFLGQWLRLNEVNATTPDERLYPEYDELLGYSLLQEPSLFFSHLIEENLSLRHLVDSDLAFVNRRLARHYGLPEVEGQELRKVILPSENPRGGILTQAAILKTTANGTVTSPVMRGNFVLTSLLGTPPAAPPPSVGSIEPDTRGKTTIREILSAHRDNATCNRCHRSIDPPGFALESFDPIGGYRTHYRATSGDVDAAALVFINQRGYREGPEVDASGVSEEGVHFSGIDEFKQILLEDIDQIARHFVSQLIVYSTGGKIEFADRSEIEAILAATRERGYPVRELIHAVVGSRVFGEG